MPGMSIVSEMFCSCVSRQQSHVVSECDTFSDLFSDFSVVFDKNDNPLTSEEEEQRAIAKIKMLGNIKFIGELGKLNLIHESILHKCIKTVSCDNSFFMNACICKSFFSAQHLDEE